MRKRLSDPSIIFNLHLIIGCVSLLGLSLHLSLVPPRGGRTMLETDYWPWNRLVYGCCRCSLWLLSRSCWHNIDAAVWLVILTAGPRSWTISFQPMKDFSFTSNRKEPDEFHIRAEEVNVALKLPAGLFIVCLYLFLLLISCCGCCGARSCLSESLSYFV